MIASGLDGAREAGRDRGVQREHGRDVGIGAEHGAEPLAPDPRRRSPRIRQEVARALRSEALGQRDLGRAHQQMGLHGELAGDRGERRVGAVGQPERRVERTLVAVAGGRGSIASDESGRSATCCVNRAGPTGSFAGSMMIVQWQCGVRSAGTRGGRWIGRIRARGLVAYTVASNVGSSIVWHMPTTRSSPCGSRLRSAPQCSSQNSPFSGSFTW